MSVQAYESKYQCKIHVRPHKTKEGIFLYYHSNAEDANAIGLVSRKAVDILSVEGDSAWDKLMIADCHYIDNTGKQQTCKMLMLSSLRMDTKAYPLISEYVEAIKLAEDNLDQLSYLRPVLDDDDLPVMSSGNFAVVFKMRDERNGKLYALKCFIKDQEGRNEAYKQIADELEFVSSEFIIPIKFFEKELFADTSNCDESEFPVLLMDWVEGITLDKYIREHLHDQYALQLICYQFCRVAAWLMAQPFAHGDLKPDNILVKNDGSLVLVDYDGMYVPAMKGHKAREVGSPDYRHPARTIDDFNESIDDFSLATIAMQLYAIALRPDLLTTTAGDTLLLRENDYRNLEKSEIMNELFSQVGNPEFEKLLAIFLLAHSEMSLSKLSFRVFNINKPVKKKRPTLISTEVTDEDLANSIEDECGVLFSLEALSTKVTNEDLQNGIEDEKYCIYSPDYSRMISYGDNYRDKYRINTRTKVICDNCFFDVYNEIDGYYLSYLHIPKSVELIGSNPFCRSIERIVCDSPYFVIEKEYLLTADKKKIVFYFGKERDIKIPNEIEHIGSGAFCSMLLSSVSIPSSVVQIDANPFVDNLNRFEDNCSPMELICDSPFFEVNNYSLFHKSEHRIIAYWGRDAIIYDLPEGIKEIGENAFFGADIEALLLPDSIEYIHETAFYWCTELKHIFVPRGSKDRIQKLITHSIYKDLVIEHDGNGLFPYF